MSHHALNPDSYPRISWQSFTYKLYQGLTPEKERFWPALPFLATLLVVHSSCSRKNSETLSRSWLQKAVITAWLQKCKNHTYSREDTHYDIPWLSSAIKRACLNGGAIPRSLAWLLHSHDYRRNAVRLAIMRCSYVAVRTKEGGGWCALPLSVLLQMQR